MTDKHANNNNSVAIRYSVKQHTDIRDEVVQMYQPEAKIKYTTTVSIIKLFLKQYCRNYVCDMKTETLMCTRNSKHLPHAILPFHILSSPNILYHTILNPNLPYLILFFHAVV